MTALLASTDMILFANEPPTYRDAMYRAFRGRGHAAILLPLEAAVEDVVGGGAFQAVVLSGTEERAKRISRSVPVVNLTYGAVEVGRAYVDGLVTVKRELRGFSELAELIENVAGLAPIP